MEHREMTDQCKLVDGLRMARRVCPEIFPSGYPLFIVIQFADLNSKRNLFLTFLPDFLCRQLTAPGTVRDPDPMKGVPGDGKVG